MKHFKRYAAFMLALFMLSAVFSDAYALPYPDADEITNEAAEDYAAVLTVLGVLKGYPDGSLRPRRPVTRAELAKMICIIKTGDEYIPCFDADISGEFGDVGAEHWARYYINYCRLNGIAAGYPDGTFRSEKAVSVTEALKMALAALGYEAKTEGLEGRNFVMNTLRLSSENGLLKNVSSSFDSCAVREEICIILGNALYSDTVTYIGESAVSRPSEITQSGYITLADEGFELADMEAAAVANDSLGLDVYSAARKGHSEFLFPDGTVRTFETCVPYEKLGREQRILFSRGGRLYGLLGESSESAAEVMTLKEAEGSLFEGADGENSDGHIFLNGKKVSAQELEAYFGQNSTAPVAVVSSFAGKYIFASEYTLVRISDVQEDYITLEGMGKTDRFALDGDNEIYAGAYALAWKNESDGVVTVKVLDRVSGNVSGYKPANDSYRIDDSYYQKSKYLSSDDESVMGRGLGAVRETEFIYWIDRSDKYEFIAKVETSDNTLYDYFGLFLYGETDPVYGRHFVKFLTSGGSAKYLETDNIPLFSEGDLFIYRTDGNGKISMTAPENTETADLKYDRRAGEFVSGSGSYRFDSGAVFISYGQPSEHGNEHLIWKAYRGGEYNPPDGNVYEARNFSDAEISPGVRLKDRVIASRIGGVRYIEAASITFDDYAEYGYVLPGLPAHAERTKIAAVLKISVKLRDGLYYYDYTVPVSGCGRTEIIGTEGSASPRTDVKCGRIYRFTLNSEGRIESAHEYSHNSGSGTDGYEKAAWTLKSYFRRPDGRYQLGAQDAEGSEYVSVIIDPDRTGVYYVKNLYTDKASVWDAEKNPLSGLLGKATVWLDYNELTGEAENVWIDCGEC